MLSQPLVSDLVCDVIHQSEIWIDTSSTSSLFSISSIFSLHSPVCTPLPHVSSLSVSLSPHSISSIFLLLSFTLLPSFSIPPSLPLPSKGPNSDKNSNNTAQLCANSLYIHTRAHTHTHTHTHTLLLSVHKPFSQTWPTYFSIILAEQRSVFNASNTQVPSCCRLLCDHLFLCFN